jgi:hypothetical protein
MEFGFDALDSLNVGQRPAFGSKTLFFGVMIGMQVFSAGMSIKSSRLSGEAEDMGKLLKDMGMEGDEINKFVSSWCDSQFLGKYGRQVSRVAQAVMWVTILPTLSAYAGF